MKTKKVIDSFKTLEKKWGPVVLMHHLIDETGLKRPELKTILKELKRKKVISQLRRRGSYFRNNTQYARWHNSLTPSQNLKCQICGSRYIAKVK